METNVIGLDISKHSFQIHEANGYGKAVLRKKVSREGVMDFFAQHRRCLVAMEACSGAHFWARELAQLGHTVKLIAPQFVKPYVKSQKNDQADAEAICEAATRPEMRFVGVKSIEQQDLQALHRVRERLIKARTALANEIRGLLAEYGVILPKGISAIRSGLLERIEHQSFRLSDSMKRLMLELVEEFHQIDRRVDGYDAKFKAISRTHPVARRLNTIPGVGPLASTALVALVADPKLFKNGRQFAAYLGLVPRQHSTGGKPKLLGITKSGDKYVRKILVHGARSVVRVAPRKSDRRSRWVVELAQRRGVNRATVACANKNARAAWCIMNGEAEYVVA